MVRLVRHLLLASIFLFTPSSAVHSVTVDWAIIGSPGNPADEQLLEALGSVDYSFRISKTEVTNAEYSDFLNAVAKNDPTGLWSTSMFTSEGGIVRKGADGNYEYEIKSNVMGVGPGGNDYSYANKPVVYVSWYSALRFANWLHNGQPAGSQSATTTEGGAYTFSGPRSVSTRNPDARVFLPNMDEWHKSAFYDASSGIYFDYPTSTDIEPNNSFSTEDTGNSANFFGGEYATAIDEDFTTGNPEYPLTDVGAYELSASPFGTFDQGGNVWEWNEDVMGNFRRIRGGAWTTKSNELTPANKTVSSAHIGIYNVGFRVAGVVIPEPTTFTLALSAICLAMGLRRSN